jgi:hypothetical protein
MLCLRQRSWLAMAWMAASAVAFAADDGYREPREISFNGTPVAIYVSKDRRTEVVFPERIVGALPPVRSTTKETEAATDGIVWTRNPTLDRIFLMPSESNYQGTITLHGASGTSYILYLRGDRNPDVLVTLADGRVRQEQQEQQAKNTPRHKLIEYMMLGKVPRGYRHKAYTGKIEDRVVFRQGAVMLYLLEAYTSPRYNGLVLVAENTGRAPVYFPIESIDFASSELRKAFGAVQELSIDSPYLGPHPAYASEAAAAPHQSLLYVQVRKEDRARP